MKLELIGIIVVENTVDGNKPQGLLPLKEGISAMAIIGITLAKISIEKLTKLNV